MVSNFKTIVPISLRPCVFCNMKIENYLTFPNQINYSFSLLLNIASIKQWNDYRIEEMKICWILNTFRVMYYTKGWLFITYLIHIICWVSDNKLYSDGFRCKSTINTIVQPLRTYAMRRKCELFVTLALFRYTYLAKELHIFIWSIIKC